jgi:Fe-S-cluster containining protein
VPSHCQSCGVCCFSPSEEYVWVTGYDWSRFGEQAAQHAQFIGNHAFMRMSDGHCAALKIRAPGGEGPHFFCSVYDLRPEICRILERGSAECLGELETKAAEVEQRFPA